MSKVKLSEKTIFTGRDPNKSERRKKHTVGEKLKIINLKKA